MLYSLQALRAFAAWLVVCHHFRQIFFDFHATGPIGQLLADRGAVGVDIFFVISGLVIYLSTRDKAIAPGQFLLNRALRIVPAYWFYTLLMAVLMLAASRWMPHQVFEWQHLLLSLLFIPAENPGGYGLYPTLNVGWTLNFEMFFYLLFGLAFLVRQRHHLWLVTAALLLASEVLGRLGVLSRFYNNDIVYEFLLGIGLGVLYRRGLIREGLWLPLGLLGLAGLALYHLDASQRLLHWGLPSALVVLAFIALERYFKGNQVLKALGDCSYSVYLVHVLVLYAGLFISEGLRLNPYLVFALCVPSIGLMSWLSYQWLERGLYWRLKAVFTARTAQEPALALSRVKY
ncbi:acyltransferase [Pseudomonas soli]|uniref:Peptidoglycan/LPS O-acetylase OafA/YrhL, contains acyltransferase and SGNH-hydrolase domains n=1 Tax=Pseudomonas soli TaxID=1306993 RepID=A0A1H9JPT4_9PSED|nr:MULTISPECIES: acyltransferase [Pseudomonas]AUY32367.1 acyltransferase [Pseudomonas sp. PONIH3]NBK39022.1 acyltransferase [Pseudomonas soli]WJO24378.1 acyltransferase [Pseudomonas soli]SEQ88862.1 Peptidoglycan/LPS O-acetylase OafA/YrhL, contains acyltransferase and SGNH-hydrolase domains [Pseudomonas soli]